MIKRPETDHLKPELQKSLGLAIVKPEPAKVGRPTDFAILVDTSEIGGQVWVHGIGANPQSCFPAVNNLGNEALIFAAPVMVKRTERGYEIVGKDAGRWCYKKYK